MNFVDDGTTVAHMRSLDPNHLAYFNLFPTYATNAQLGTTGDTVTAYNAYLSQYVNTVSPSLISYDHYTFMATYDDSQYLQNLGLVANAAKQANVPFMNVVQACTWDNTFRLPNANQMQYQVYTTLAYGAQSICYFDYSSDPNGNPNSGGLSRPPMARHRQSIPRYKHSIQNS